MKDNLIKFPEWKKNYEEMVQYLEDAHGAENIFIEKVFDAEGNFSGMRIGIKGIHF